MLMVGAGMDIDTLSRHKVCTSHSDMNMALTCMFEQMCGGVLYYCSTKALQSVSKDARKTLQHVVHAVVSDV